MSTFFGFSDECGDYVLAENKRQIRAHPYYIRSNIIINSINYKRLSKSFKDLKQAYNLPLNKEIKWSYLYRLDLIQKGKQNLESNPDIKFLEKISYGKLLQFVEDTISLLNGQDDTSVILTYSDNSIRNNFSIDQVLKMHLQDHIQRFEYYLSDKKNDDLGVLFFDPVSEKRNDFFRNKYYDMSDRGDFIKYEHIKDSLNFEYSHHSVGIQIADFVAGCFSSVLKSGNNNNNYGAGIKIFSNYVYPLIRKGYNGKCEGYGIMDIPYNNKVRNIYMNKIKSLLP